MKKIFNLAVITLLVMGISNTYAQKEDKSKRKSPPAKATGTVGSASITIDYSQPSVKGRIIWGDLVPYGKVWRSGANEATTFEASADIMVEGKELKAGKYSFFTIPAESGEWTVIFNKVHEQWGAYKYNKAEDALRVKVKANKDGKSVEQLTYRIMSKGDKTFVGLMWENVKVPITLSAK